MAHALRAVEITVLWLGSSYTESTEAQLGIVNKAPVIRF